MNILSKLLQFQNQAKLIHWQTGTYAEHKAFGELYDEISDTMDSIIEQFQGSVGRIVGKDGFSFQIKNYGDITPAVFLNEMSDYLVNEFPKQIEAADTNLTNLRDELLGEVNKTKYLITLR